MKTNVSLLQFLQNTLNPIGCRVTTTPEDILLYLCPTPHNLGMLEVIDITTPNCNHSVIIHLVAAYLHLLKLPDEDIEERKVTAESVFAFRVSCDGYIACVMIAFHEKGCQINMFSEIS